MNITVQMSENTQPAGVISAYNVFEMLPTLELNNAFEIK
jgi:hypothetical protein